MKKSGYVSIFFVGIVAVIFLPRVLSLNAHWSSDETGWLQNSHRFATALQERDFSETLQGHHPGVPTMWLGGLGLWYEYGDALVVAPYLVTRNLFSPTQLAHARFPIALLTGFTILVIGLLLRRLLGNAVACVGMLFLALDPFLLAESRRLHTDALSASFLMISVLYWLCYLETDVSRCRDIVFSGISFGLACLSKSLAGAFLLFLPLLLFGYAKHGLQMTSRLLWAVCLWAATVVSTIILLWPYLWTLHLGAIPLFPLLMAVALGLIVIAVRCHSNPGASVETLSLMGRAGLPPIRARLWKGIIVLGLLGIIAIVLSASSLILTRLYWALITPHEVPQLFLGKVSHAQNGFYYPVHGVVWSAPLTIPLVLFAIWQFLKQRKQAPSVFRVGLVLLLLGCFYLWGLTFVAKKLARYIVITTPAWDVLAAIGTVSLVKLLQNIVRKPILAWTVLILVIFLQTAPVLSLHPNYRAYHHPAIPANWIVNNISQGGGIGLDFAAEYLNDKPNAERLTVYTTPLGGFIEHYFNGQTRAIDTQITHLAFDYVIVYIRDKQIGGLPPKELFQRLTLEHVVRINEVDYAWIYRKTVNQ